VVRIAITIKDIAKMAGVSTTTVSKIINHKDQNIGGETIKRVKEIIKEQNYTPNRLARSLVTKKSQTIGLIIPDVRNPFFTSLVRSVEDVAEKYNYNVFFCNTDESLKKEIQSIAALDEKMVEGIVIIPASKLDDDKNKRQLLSVPTVVIDRDATYKNVIGKVISDNYHGAYKATKHLIDLGHKKIAFVSGPIEIKPSIDRKQGFLDACKDYGIISSEIFIGSFEVEFGRKIGKELDNKYTGVFCGNDLIAAGIIQGLRDKGRSVPRDVSVIGFDDIPLAKMINPELSTIKQDSYRIGQVAAEILINYLEKPHTDQKLIELETDLIIRDSARKVD
jgi:LacI family transcriptional regulator